MILEAIFSEETLEYLSPCEPNFNDDIYIRIRTAKNDIKNVYLLVDDEEILMHKPDFDEILESGLKVAQNSNEFFDYYITKLTLNTKELKYQFKIEGFDEIKYYTKVGFFDYPNHTYSFRVIADFKTPDWAKGAIMYQIYIDRFNRGKPNNHVLTDEYIYIGKRVSYVDDWEEFPHGFDVGRFYGGNLQGVQDKLYYLKSLGVQAIYFNPLFVSPSNHKYDTQDYDYIDPHLTVLESDIGDVLPADDNNDTACSDKYIERTTNIKNLEASNKFFANFVKIAHNMNIKIIIDGVFNHCGSFNKWLDREKIYSNSSFPAGAYQNENSKYRSYFNFFENGEYEGWWGHNTLPKLNYEGSDELVNEVIGIAKKWLMPPFNVDGWRLDVAADLGHSKEFNHKFWQIFRQAVKEVNPNAIIIAEHYGDPYDWLDGSQWDTVMNYDAFMEPISWFLTGLEKHSDRSDMSLLGNGYTFFDMLKYAKSRFPMPAYMVSMNQLSNHDHSRFLTRTNKKVGRIDSLGSEAAAQDVNEAIFRQAIMMQLTMQGAPTLYYGDEAGVFGFTDPDNRRTYPWGKENHELLEYYRYMNLIHNEYDVLKHGSFIELYKGENIISYARTYGEQLAIVAIYTGAEKADFDLPVWLAGFMPDTEAKRVMYSYSTGYNAGMISIPITDKFLHVELKPYSCVLYVIS